MKYFPECSLYGAGPDKVLLYLEHKNEEHVYKKVKEYIVSQNKPLTI